MGDLEISLVDDHRFLMDGLIESLKVSQPGVRVVGTYVDWDQCVANLQSLGDVLLLDVVLQDVIPLSAKIRAVRTSGTQVIAMSTLTEPAVVHQAMMAGAMSFVAKSANTQTLGDAIRSAARGDVYATPEVLLAQGAVGPPVHVTAREHQVLALYLGGKGNPMENVASQLGITKDMVKKHLGSVRRKYLDSGRSVPTRLSLRRQLLQDGWLIEAGPAGPSGQAQ